MRNSIFSPGDTAECGLKMMGKVPVEFVRTPASWHTATSKPSQYLAYWEKMVEWFVKYVEFRPEEYE